MKKIAILDDYQSVARKTADWSAVQGRADVTSSMIIWLMQMH
jgi:hypothetical protein